MNGDYQGELKVCGYLSGLGSESEANQRLIVARA